MLSCLPSIRHFFWYIHFHPLRLSVHRPLMRVVDLLDKSRTVGVDDSFRLILSVPKDPPYSVAVYHVQVGTHRQNGFSISKCLTLLLFLFLFLLLLLPLLVIMARRGKRGDKHHGYTVTYDSSSHIKVISQLWGSVWPKVCPLQFRLV